MPALTVKGLIVTLLLMDVSRKATKVQILERARKLPYVHRALTRGTLGELKEANKMLKDVAELLDEEKLLFDVEFPPEGYVKLRAEFKRMARRDHVDTWLAWRAQIGAEIAEEEEDPEGEPRYQCEFWDADEEFERRRTEGRGPRECVFVAPPGQENIILGPEYDTELTPTESHNPSFQDYFSRLPPELKGKIARFVLVLPGKVRVTAKIFSDDDDWRGDNIKQLTSTTYKFSLSAKVPRFMVPQGATSYKDGYYWSLEHTSTLLALLAVNREFHSLCKPIFYSENYFEVLDAEHEDGIEDIRLRDGGGHRLAHQFLEFLSWPRSHDGISRYGVRPLGLLRKVNIDFDLLGYDQSQTPWHFDRIINAIIAIPNLNKLVINVRMTGFDQLYVEGVEKIWDHPEHWPGFRKLPWAASTIISKTTTPELKLKVYIPENRKAQKWLQDLINSPGDDHTKLALPTRTADGDWNIIPPYDEFREVDLSLIFGTDAVNKDNDWSIEQCPPKMITEGMLAANQRRMEAIKKAGLAIATSASSDCDEDGIEHKEKTPGTDESIAVMSYGSNGAPA